MTSIRPAPDPAHSDSALVRQSLGQAFVCFREAAESLERSYRQLEGEVAHLRRELEERNAELARSLEEKIRMRDGLHTILEGLPCGVLVTQSGGAVSFVNRAATRLLAALMLSLAMIAGPTWLTGGAFGPEASLPALSVSL